MIKHDGKKVTSKKKASLVWEMHLSMTCAWAEWDEEGFHAMSQKEHDETMKQMEKLYARMQKMLAKARGE